MEKVNNSFKNDGSKRKLQVYVTEETYNSVLEESRAYGMSVSAFMNFCTVQYLKQNQVVAEMSKFQDYITQLKTIELAMKNNK